MKVNHERLEGNQVVLNVEVEVEKVEKALQQAYRKVVKDVKIPGFRKGRVPRKILEARYGVEVLYNDALDILLPEAYTQAVDEAGIDPIDRPEIEEVNIEQGEPVTFTAKVLVKPEVELGQYTGLDLEKEEIAVTDEDINAEIEGLQQRHTQIKTIEDRDVVEKGDIAIIDFEGFIDGEPFEGGTSEEYSLEIGSNTFIEGFEEQLIGVAVGEETEVNVTFPEDYRAENLAGQPVTFKVTINELKEKELPELDDDFAKEASEFETLDELKEDIKNKLVANAQERAQRNFENQMIDAVAETTTIDIPAKMVDDQLEQMYQNMNMNLYQQGFTLDQYLESMGSSVEEWKDQQRDEAEKQVRANLTLEAIAKKEGIMVSDDEIDSKIAELAKNNNQDPEQLKQFLVLQGRLDSLLEGLTMEKVIDYLVENNKK